jgi:hypothetical protein
MKKILLVRIPMGSFLYREGMNSCDYQQLSFYEEYAMMEYPYGEGSPCQSNRCIPSMTRLV